jgi:hypothetical protein
MAVPKRIDEPGVSSLGWWSISGESLMEMLNRCYEGSSPTLVYAEEYANSEIERPKDGS